MFRTAVAILKIRLRDLLLMLTLVSHLLGTFGFPLLVPASSSKDASTPYPCKGHQCGCRNAQECWAGDCCCYTLEEKLVWAEANGIEPPEHVRPLVESRKSEVAKPKNKSSCCEAEVSKASDTTDSTSCCPKMHRSACPSCCEPSTNNCNQSADDCDTCAAQSLPNCQETKSPSESDEGNVRWVVGFFAQKCRGVTPAGLMKLDPSVLPDTDSQAFAAAEPGEFLAGFHPILFSTSYPPPSPPPRCS
jgi:hypothetical protein